MDDNIKKLLDHNVDIKERTKMLEQPITAHTQRLVENSVDTNRQNVQMRNHGNTI